tara:strand:- start:1 stop:462 length:462 start_codon:yes stop_codon:yes gene_type:complete
LNDFTVAHTYRISPDSLASPELKPEERLWRSVVVTALEDTLIEHSDRKHSIAKIKAHNWILGNLSDFQEICCWTNLESDVIISNYRKSLKQGMVTFNKKQILWFRYDRVYQKLKENLSPVQKRHIRSQVKKMRYKIHHTPVTTLSNVFVSSLF